MARFPSLLALALCAAPTAAAALEIGLPIDCAVPETCVIQNYVDTDPGPGACDHAGGGLTFDGHKGTDFRLRDHHAMRAGVAVLAAAEGIVERIRDGQPDGGLRRGGVSAGPACGNGVVLRHDGGWETQYCHLRQGSIIVSPGDAVPAGARLGLAGMSGMATFPHVHLSVRDPHGVVIDPYTGLTPGVAACAMDGAPLWSEAVRSAVAHRSPLIQKSGFTGAASGLIEVIDGTAPDVTPGGDAPGLVFYGRAIGLSAGDVLSVTLEGPAGFAPIRNRAEPLARAKAQYMVFTGRTRPPGGFPPGDYTGRFTVMRDGAPQLQTSRTIRLD